MELKQVGIPFNLILNRRGPIKTRRIIKAVNLSPISATHCWKEDTTVGDGLEIPFLFLIIVRE